MNVPFEWSEKMEKLFNRLVVAPVLNDPRTELSEDITLGYPFAVIRNDIIKEGLADFSVGYDDGVHGALTPSEKVLLYCFVNMKSHFFTSHAAFLHHERNLKKLLDEKLLIIDIGCGPGTAGLAFLETFPAAMFDYVGVDSAKPMPEKAVEFFAAANTTGLARRKIGTFFVSDWQSIKKHKFGTDNAVLIVFSYFFASESLKSEDLASLASIVKKMKGHRPQKPVAILHMNSARDRANRNYLRFRKLLGFESKHNGLVRQKVEFRKKRGSPVTTVHAEFVHEFLWL